ncbi:receptor-type tyrosine-protein phosphatase eta-like [Protopterus annectens]|uniref:receptor-type tyrosine-protein phosphatase eta-like n=1 Tax=Protopterus annectens TaxID=7888 RepID=UPI001CFC22EB|nr:receptor-type tyrosine-protein phosphatase eta-like [Protopterus annectens]
MSLTWDAPDCSHVKYHISGLPDYEEGKEVFDTSETICDLQCGDVYSFQVETVAADGVTKGVAETVKGYTEPLPVLNLHVSEVNTSCMSLKWDAPDCSHVTYHIFGLPDYEEGREVFDTSETICDLQCGDEYSYIVETVAADGVTIGVAETVKGYTGKILH